MTKRIVAGFLWFYLATYAWNMYAGLTGLNWLWGPVVVLSVVAAIAAARVRQSWAANDRLVAGRSVVSAADPV